MSALTELSAADLTRAVVTFDSLLQGQKEVINSLNVYPVPDGDTGTNMALTMHSVVKALTDLPATASLGEVTKALAKSSLLGARGNSGVILSQMLRGFVEGFPADGAISVEAFRAGLTLADERARHAVSRPVEGTILSVARAAALGAAEGETLTDAVRAARESAVVALAHTPEQLPVLKQAGVVDSGGTGLVLWFDALCHVVCGDELPATPEVATSDFSHLRVEADEMATLAGLRYEVMYLLEGNDDAMGAFRAAWEALGDSIVIVGGEGLYNCHIHTDHIGPSIEAAFQVGLPREIRVTDLLEQAGEEGWVLGGESTPVPTTAVVAVATGSGVADLFTSLGVRRVVVGGQTMNPSTQELADAVRATGATQVIILPNNKNIRATAEQVNEVVDVDVRVVPTVSIVEGLAALTGYRPDDALEDNVATMANAAAAVVTGEVTQAVRDTTSDAGPVATGDWIGLTPSGIVGVSSSLDETLLALVTALIDPSHELLTLIVGEGASEATTDAFVKAVSSRWPEVEIDIHQGRQPLYPYLLGLE